MKSLTGYAKVLTPVDVIDWQEIARNKSINTVIERVNEGLKVNYKSGEAVCMVKTALGGFDDVIIPLFEEAGWDIKLVMGGEKAVGAGVEIYEIRKPL